eukprot:sb/3478681/
MGNAGSSLSSSREVGPRFYAVSGGNHTTLTGVSDNRQNRQHNSFKRQCRIISHNSYSEDYLSRGALARALWALAGFYMTYHVTFHVMRCCDPGPRLTS